MRRPAVLQALLVAAPVSANQAAALVAAGADADAAVMVARVDVVAEVARLLEAPEAAMEGAHLDVRAPVGRQEEIRAALAAVAEGAFSCVCRKIKRNPEDMVHFCVARYFL